jgi:hypothetical protein
MSFLSDLSFHCSFIIYFTKNSLYCDCRMRWKVHAVPRGWWETEGTFDGISTYRLDSEGRIYEHYIDNVQLRDPPITNPLLYGYNLLMRPRTAVPYPGSYGFVAEDGMEGGAALGDAMPGTQ